jgi:paraquat-inducible protein A
VIVFIASIAVPVLKIGVLGLLAWTVRYAPGWRRLERARLYRLIEVVGHWSMLDVYVVVLLAATVRFGPLASVQAGPGLLSFAAVVVLTLLATWSFDPRMIWQESSRHG